MEVIVAQSTTLTNRSKDFESERNTLSQQAGLPFLDILSHESVEDACRSSNHSWRDQTKIKGQASTQSQAVKLVEPAKSGRGVTRKPRAIWGARRL
jgi:hypothetical protein